MATTVDRFQGKSLWDIMVQSVVCTKILDTSIKAATDTVPVLVLHCAVRVELRTVSRLLYPGEGYGTTDP